MLRFAPFLCFALLACGAHLPDFDSRTSEAARNANPPELQPLGPLLIRADELLPRNAADEGRTLEARAADLRRRAGQLRRMPL